MQQSHYGLLWLVHVQASAHVDRDRDMRVQNLVDISTVMILKFFLFLGSFYSTFTNF